MRAAGKRPRLPMRRGSHGARSLLRRRSERRIGEYYTVCLYSFARRLPANLAAQGVRQMNSVRRQRPSVGSEGMHQCWRVLGAGAEKEKPGGEPGSNGRPHSPRTKAERPLTSRHLSSCGGRTRIDDSLRLVLPRRTTKRRTIPRSTSRIVRMPKQCMSAALTET